MARIGFIGVGNMGGPMARNLMKAQHTVTAFDPLDTALAAIVEAGAVQATSAAAAVEGADAVVTMVPAGPHVREIYLGAGGIIAAAAPETLLMDCSTIDVTTARNVAGAAAERGLDMVDAPVSGGTGGAIAGTLTFMVGGSEAAFAKARPILEHMGARIVHCGPAGNGQAAKVCNNMMLAINMLGVVEGFTLADNLGLDRQVLFDVVANSSGQSWAVSSYCPVPGPVPASPANNGFQPGFTADMMVKDLRLARDAAMKSGTGTPMGALAEALMALHVSAGNGPRDFSSIIETIRAGG
ncbi:MAG: 3-hydroxyisobutyrate dehydrogenase [Alphaproteobacteria bacterium]|nr:3-hydroxyisobutyrate dehydrogenase [Alphaproteobacteria bacterium]MCY4320176.1 3-hydroxyisobutyrate dehydrogenase [Alphaproteobacteria bacterium]